VCGSFGFAVFGWLMGSLGHDAGHFAASHRYPQVNEWGVWAMCLICNPIMWQQQHTYGHHSFTNEVSHDPDIHHFDWLLRVHKGVPYDPKYRSQRNRLYVAFAYSFVVFGTAFYIPITMIQSGSLYGMVDWHDKDRPVKAIGMRLHNLCYFLVVMVAPFLSHHSAWTALMAVSLHIATLGILFGVFSQVNHLNEASLEADMETRQRDGSSSNTTRDPRLTHSWAVSQVETSNNFASQSWFWHLLSNGLNHQIEHHLFPSLNHAHLHLIAPTVRQTCDEYGVNYKSFDSWADIMSATLRWYSQLSFVADENLVAKRE
jgi:fatty acid desaturase